LNKEWIAYSLMDSIVDAFFPLINFIEGESRELDGYLADPLGEWSHNRSLHEDDASSRIFRSSTRASRKVVVTQTQTFISLPGPFQYLPLPSLFVPLLPSKLLQTKSRSRVKRIVLNVKGRKVKSEQYVYPSKPRRLGEALGASLPVDPKVLVRRIADSRKLVTAMSRLLGPKTDVVRGMRKRSREAGDIGMYLGDLQGEIITRCPSKWLMDPFSDHIITMQQSLTFYEVILSHDHPVLVGILRLTLEATKSRNDKVRWPLSAESRNLINAYAHKDTCLAGLRYIDFYRNSSGHGRQLAQRQNT